MRYRSSSRTGVWSSEVAKLDDLGWLGTSLILLGTNALFAYEAKAAVRIESGLLVTGVVDVLFDAWRRLMMSGENNKRGLMGFFKKWIDHFRRQEGGPIPLPTGMATWSI